jgi:CBS domain-containing protein
MLSFTISRRFQPVPVYHALLRQDNVHLPAASTDDNDTMVARDVMRPSVDTSNATLSIASVLESVEAAHAGSRLIVDDHGLLVGYVTHEQLVDALARGLGTAAVSTIANDDVPHVHGDHPLDVVLARLSAARGAVPVLSRNNVRHVEGIVTLETITKRFAANDTRVLSSRWAALLPSCNLGSTAANRSAPRRATRLASPAARVIHWATSQSRSARNTA